MNFSSIKNIIFDLGGVIINIDFQLTFNAFAKLTGLDIHNTAEKFKSLRVFERYEAGEFTDEQFRNLLRKELNISHSDEEIDLAWNGLLLDIPAERIHLIQELSKKYNVFLLSNTNNIHIIGVNEILKDSTGIASLQDIFQKVYLSYEMKLSKPHTKIYETVLKEQGLNPTETLFIDDNKANIEGAKAAGLHTIFVESPITILDYLKDA